MTEREKERAAVLKPGPWRIIWGKKRLRPEFIERLRRAHMKGTGDE